MAAAEGSEEVEFRVAELVSLATRRERSIPYIIIKEFFKKYDSYLATATEDEARQLLMPVGRHPIKHVFLVDVKVYEKSSITLGRVGFVLMSRFPEVLNLSKRTIHPLQLPRTEALINLSHFAVFGFGQGTFIIYEMNSSAPTIGQFTKYMCSVWRVIDPVGAPRWCDLKFKFIQVDPIAELSLYRYVTGLTVSGELKASVALSSFLGTDIKQALMKRRTKRFSIELSGHDDPLEISIDEILELIDRLRSEGAGDLSSILSRLTVRVRKTRFGPSTTINLLRNVLSFLRSVPHARDPQGNELGSLDSKEAFKTLRELVDEAISIIQGQGELRRRESRITLERWLGRSRAS